MKWTYFIIRWIHNKAEWWGPFNTREEAKDWNISQKPWKRGFIQAARGEAALRIVADIELRKP